MSLHLHVWLMRLPIWRWFARAAADRVTDAETEQYRDVKSRAESGVFGKFRPSDEWNTDGTKHWP